MPQTEDSLVPGTVKAPWRVDGAGIGAAGVEDVLSAEATELH